LTGLTSGSSSCEATHNRKLKLGVLKMKPIFVKFIQSQVKKQQLLKESQQLMAKKPQIC
jgi:hypothetical protein